MWRTNYDGQRNYVQSQQVIGATGKSANYSYAERKRMAQAVKVGAPVSEVAAEYGTSVPYVLAQVKWHEDALRQRRIQAKIERERDKAARAVANVIDLRPHKPVPEPLKSAVGRELGIMKLSDGVSPSMPYVAFLHGS
ncbi:hypothetical protein EL18_02090 [Nitratireductor basaltis]|uniref:Uncharacterized protein n=1 Tax=Nitratireductor basaltis TaxID=472175 RepID=A0A084UDL2_9HYPH|nr:hypothetical protein EL18_02090 [Nitratireductor basaltis]